jgi:hypothetical protein
MKKLYLGIFTIVQITLNAQLPSIVVEDSTFNNIEFDSLMKFIDKSKINTGILYEKALQIIDFKYFSGSINSRAAKSSEFKQLYRQCIDASVISSLNSDLNYLKKNKSYTQHNLKIVNPLLGVMFRGRSAEFTIPPATLLNL